MTFLALSALYATLPFDAAPALGFALGCAITTVLVDVLEGIFL